MHIRFFTSIAICAVALGLTGCRVQTVLVAPSLVPYPYAAAGQTLEWLPSSPKAAPIYVIFDSPSPCAKQFYQIGPDPARCRVLKGYNGYFTYHFDTQPPPPTPPPTGGERSLLARSCPYCVIAINPPSGNGAVETPGVKGTDAGTGYSLTVSCTAGVATVDSSPVQSGVQDKDLISWVPIYPSQQVTVTTHNNMCTGGTKGVFTANQVCTVYGPPSSQGQPPISYPYEVSLDKCATPGSSKITINPPPPNSPSPAQ